MVPFIFNATASSEIYTLSLHDALPIFYKRHLDQVGDVFDQIRFADPGRPDQDHIRSEEHTSELQSRENLVCRLLLEKKNLVGTDSHTTMINDLDVLGCGVCGFEAEPAM